MARRRTATEMFPLIEQYLRRSVTQKTFCTEHDLPQSVLTYWLAKYRRHQSGESTSAFIEITPPPPTETALLEIIYPHGVRLRLFAPLPPAYLEALVRLGMPVR